MVRSFFHFARYAANGKGRPVILSIVLRAEQVFQKLQILSLLCDRITRDICGQVKWFRNALYPLDEEL